MDCLWLTVLAICVECPKCLTQYLIGFSPTVIALILCRRLLVLWIDTRCTVPCRSPCAVSRWNQVRACQVSNAAYTRGYGTPEEVALVITQTWNSWSFDISRYLNLSPFQKNRNS